MLIICLRASLSVLYLSGSAGAFGFVSLFCFIE